MNALHIIRALERLGWTYDWNADAMHGRGFGWSSPKLGYAISMTEAIVRTARAMDAHARRM